MGSNAFVQCAATSIALFAIAACTGASNTPSAAPSLPLSDAQELEYIARTGQEIESARNAPFDREAFNQKLLTARGPFDACIQDQIDNKVPKMNSPGLTPNQKANGLLSECRSSLQPVFDLIYVSPLANDPAASNKVVDVIWSDGRQRLIAAF